MTNFEIIMGIEIKIFTVLQILNSLGENKTINITISEELDEGREKVHFMYLIDNEIHLVGFNTNFTNFQFTYIWLQILNSSDCSIHK